MKHYLFVFFVGNFILFSCATSSNVSQQQVYNSWIGHHKSEIIRSWGPPMSGTSSDGNGGEILLYVDSRTITGRPPGNLNLPYVSRTISDYKYVYCNSAGVIYLIKYGRQ